METKSIYETISENVTEDHQLPPGFWLPQQEETDDRIDFIPGAKDGIAVFHFGADPGDDDAAAIFDLLIKDWESETNQFTEDIACILNKSSTLTIIDPLLAIIRNNQDTFELTNAINYAYYLAFFTADVELVKLGIAILGLVKWSNKDVINKLETLALYDEFTLFVVIAFASNGDRDEKIFSIAAHVNGWGKIHAVKYLESDREIVHRWLLCEGCKNEINNSYLGLKCAEKGNMIDALRLGVLDEPLYEGICVIIDALLDEGPADGISAYEHAGEALLLFLNIADKKDDSIAHLNRVINIRKSLEYLDINEKEEIREICNGIITNKT